MASAKSMMVLFGVVLMRQCDSAKIKSSDMSGVEMPFCVGHP